MFGEFLNRFFDEFKAVKHFLWRLSRENMMLHARHFRYCFSFPYEAQSQVIGLSSQHNGVDRLKELAHAVIARRARTIQPINRAIFARDEAVGAGGDVNDNLSHLATSLTTFGLREAN